MSMLFASELQKGLRTRIAVSTTSAKTPSVVAVCSVPVEKEDLVVGTRETPHFSAASHGHYGVFGIGGGRLLLALSWL